MRLLAKSADDRYQTAAALEADLRKSLAEWEAHGRIEKFPLGMRDVSDRLMIPERLYGREREIETMLAAFDRVVADGATELVLVSGYSGVGKSSVVHELHKALVPPRGLFAAGKFDQYKRDVPYAIWAQSFQTLVRHILGKGEVELGEWREALREALGANGALIVSLVPELELVIGKQPPVADLPPQDAKNRFQLVLRRFLSAFARKEHPLALFLDDLQWLDTATLELVEQLVTQSEGRRLLLIGAYRDNEVGPAHPLLRTLEAIREAGARVHEISLSPLGVDDVGQLVADGLHCQPERARPLAQLVLEKTSGNPFFAIQFITALADQGLIAFDPAAPAWQWDIDRIRAKGYTDNVVDFMVEKLKRLSASTQEALKLLACLGNVAEVATLAVVQRDTEEAIHTTLWEAVHAGVVCREDNAYKFLHDRIQQAAYSLIPDERRAGAHLRIGRALLAGLTADQFADYLFDVANQLNRGAARLADRDEKAQVATIARIEGRDLDAERQYEQAIRLARAHDFVHNEALAYEVAARFYSSRGFENFASAYLRNAWSCYLRWGAHGKVKQLDRLYPHLAVAEDRTATISSIQQLDFASIVKASQALSSEIELPKLIERLMTIALENAGADRGLLILPAGDDYLIRAQGQTIGNQVEVVLRQTPISRLTCPNSLLRYVIRTCESMIIEDTLRLHPFSGDEYLRGHQPRSILCLPLIKQGRLTGLIYLENTLTAYAFTPNRIAVLELLAAQAAISLEKTRLYSELQEREAKVRRLVNSNIIGIYIWDVQGRIIDANEAFLDIVGYSREDLMSGRLSYPGLTPPEWNDVSERARAVIKTTGTASVFEKEYLRKDGGRVPILLGGATFGEGQDQGVAFVLDLTERKRAEQNLLESERRYREAQAELAHVNRVATVGQLTASIAHEINQPLAAIASNGAAGLNWLNRKTPDLDEAREAFSSIVGDTARASDMIRGLRALVKKSGPQLTNLDIDEAIREVLAIAGGELRRNEIVLRTNLMAGGSTGCGRPSSTAASDAELDHEWRRSYERGYRTRQGADGVVKSR